MKFFRDKQLTEEIKTIKFGIVPVGGVGRVEVFVQNDGRTYLRELKFKPAHNEVKVIQAPASLDPGEADKLVLEWRPAVDLEEGLETTIFIEGAKLAGKL